MTTGASWRQDAGRSALAEYTRRRRLHAAERRDHLGRSVAIGVAAAVGVGLATGALVWLAEAPVALAVELGAAALVLVLVLAALRFFRVPEEIESWRANARAERRTARALRRLTRAGYTVLHDRGLPDSAGNIDHLVVGPSGAWMIETDSHRGPLRRNQAGLWAGKIPLRPMLGLVGWMGEKVTSGLVEELPDGWQLESQAVVAFDRAEPPHGLALIDGVVVLPTAAVADYILAAGVILKPLDVAMLVDVAERVFPRYPVEPVPASGRPFGRRR